MFLFDPTNARRLEEYLISIQQHADPKEFLSKLQEGIISTSPIMNERIARLFSMLWDETDERIAELESELNGMESERDSLSEKVSELEEKLKELNEKLESLVSDCAEHVQRIVELERGEG
jgi:uncharacterized coiled-coil DUF342 family protein